MLRTSPAARRWWSLQGWRQSSCAAASSTWNKTCGWLGEWVGGWAGGRATRTDQLRVAHTACITRVCALPAVPAAPGPSADDGARGVDGRQQRGHSHGAGAGGAAAADGAVHLCCQRHADQQATPHLTAHPQEPPGAPLLAAAAAAMPLLSPPCHCCRRHAAAVPCCCCFNSPRHTCPRAHSTAS